ncbi:Agamous-like MADS-box protein [Arachis hypogaea]|nr:Agamous-like MADS-box protein [Arachis hypogaea]
MDNNGLNLFSAPQERRVSFAELARQYEMATNNNDDDIPKMKRRVKLQLIDDMNSRKATFRKRRAGLLKKLEQLAILCDIQACIAIFSPGDKSPTVWPSVEEAKEIVERFEEIPESERSSRMVTHPEYRKQKVIWMEKQLEKLKKLNDQKEMDIFMHQIYNEHRPVTDFSDDELDRFLTYVDDKLKAVRNSIIRTHRSKVSISSQPLPAPPSAVAVQPLIISGEVDSRLFFEDESNGSVLFPVGDENVLVVPPAEANEELFGFGDFDDSVDFGDLDNFGDLTVGTDDNEDDDDFLIDELLLPNQGNAAGNTSNDNHKGLW